MTSVVNEGNIDPDNYKIPENAPNLNKSEAEKAIDDVFKGVFDDLGEPSHEPTHISNPSIIKVEPQTVSYPRPQVDLYDIKKVNKADIKSQFDVENANILRNGEMVNFPRGVVNKQNMYSLNVNNTSKTSNFKTVFNIKEKVNGFVFADGELKHYNLSENPTAKTLELFKNGKLVIHLNDKFYMKESNAKAHDNISLNLNPPTPETVKNQILKSGSNPVLSIVSDDEWHKTIHVFQKYLTAIKKPQTDDSLKNVAKDVNVLAFPKSSKPQIKRNYKILAKNEPYDKPISKKIINGNSQEYVGKLEKKKREKAEELKQENKKLENIIAKDRHIDDHTKRSIKINDLNKENN